MKSLREAIFALAIVAGVVPAALAHGDYPARRGGTQVWAGEMLLEFVVRRDRVAVYLDDHGDEVALKGAEGTLVVKERAVPMKVANNGFEASGLELKKGEKLLFFAKMPDGNVHTAETVAP